MKPLFVSLWAGCSLQALAECFLSSFLSFPLPPSISLPLSLSLSLFPSFSFSSVDPSVETPGGLQIVFSLKPTCILHSAVGTDGSYYRVIAVGRNDLF